MNDHTLILSISTGSFMPLPLSVALRTAARAGLDGVELVVSPEVRRRGARQIARMSRAYDLQILSIHQALLGTAPPPERMHEAVELALALNAPRVILHTPGEVSWHTPTVEAWVSTLENLIQQTRGSGTQISIENYDLNPALDPPVILGKLEDLLDFAYVQGARITLDTCHADRSGLDLLEAYQTVRNRLINIHLSDRRDIGEGERSHWKRMLFANHRVPGEGNLPLERLLARLAADGYPHTVTIEVNPWALHNWSPGARQRRLNEVVAYVRRAIASPPKEVVKAVQETAPSR